VADDGRLPPKAADALTAPDTEIYVSPISTAEVACAFESGKLKLDRHWKRWFRHFVEVNGWEIIPIDLDIIEEAYSLPSPFHRDPADRIIVATARRRGLAVVTADEKILAYPHVDTVWKE
jgi:PIN domain nuclease of toxin-antitoxin system